MDFTAYAVLLNIAEYKVLIFHGMHIKVARSKTVETLTNINLKKKKNMNVCLCVCFLLIKAR